MNTFIRQKYRQTDKTDIDLMQIKHHRLSIKIVHHKNKTLQQRTNSHNTENDYRYCRKPNNFAKIKNGKMVYAEKQLKNRRQQQTVSQ